MDIPRGRAVGALLRVGSVRPGDPHVLVGQPRAQVIEVDSSEGGGSGGGCRHCQCHLRPSPWRRGRGGLPSDRARARARRPRTPTHHSDDGHPIALLQDGHGVDDAGHRRKGRLLEPAAQGRQRVTVHCTGAGAAASPPVCAKWTLESSARTARDRAKRGARPPPRCGIGRELRRASERQVRPGSRGGGEEGTGSQRMCGGGAR